MIYHMYGYHCGNGNHSSNHIHRYYPIPCELTAEEKETWQLGREIRRIGAPDLVESPAVLGFAICAVQGNQREICNGKDIDGRWWKLRHSMPCNVSRSAGIDGK